MGGLIDLRKTLNSESQKALKNLKHGFKEFEVITAEIKALHYCAYLFYEKTEVKTKMLSIIQDFAVAKNNDLLKIGKLSSSSTQKQGNYKLETEEESEVEHGFVENFMQLFTLRDRRHKMRAEISEMVC